MPIGPRLRQLSGRHAQYMLKSWKKLNIIPDSVSQSRLDLIYTRLAVEKAHMQLICKCTHVGVANGTWLVFLASMVFLQLTRQNFIQKILLVISSRNQCTKQPTIQLCILCLGLIYGQILGPLT